MTTSTKAILVLPSAGQGSSDPVPQDLQDYCAALAAVTPTSAIRTEERGQDLAQLNMAASIKSTQVDPSEYGVSPNWTPVAYHIEDENAPGQWISDSNARGLKYEATFDETTYVIFVQMAN